MHSSFGRPLITILIVATGSSDQKDSFICPEYEILSSTYPGKIFHFSETTCKLHDNNGRALSVSIEAASETTARPVGCIGSTNVATVQPEYYHDQYIVLRYELKCFVPIFILLLYPARGT